MIEQDQAKSVVGFCTYHWLLSYGKVDDLRSILSPIQPADALKADRLLSHKFLVVDTVVFHAERRRADTPGRQLCVSPSTLTRLCGEAISGWARLVS